MIEDLGFTVPQFACDCHIQVFGPLDRYPAAAQRDYTPTPAPRERWRDMAAPLGVQRVVLVQPSGYGTDNTCMLDTLRTSPPGSARGIAVIDAATSEAELDEMHELGVRGIRVNLFRIDTLSDQATTWLRRSAERIAGRGWHVQLFARAPTIQALAPVIATLDAPIVIDHMGKVDPANPADRPALNTLLKLLGDGRCWVKLSGSNRFAREDNGYREALPLLRALIEANSARLVWGTDWPHIGPSTPESSSYLPVNNAALLRLFGESAENEVMRRRILVENPAELYGFSR